MTKYLFLGGNMPSIAQIGPAYKPKIGNNFSYRTVAIEMLNGPPITDTELNEGPATGRVSDSGNGGFIGLLCRSFNLLDSQRVIPYFLAEYSH